ncbi:MAG: rhodanese-like domain-containing protein [Candidatus Obscuribacterales bacterium]|nr:rhodanese-like domain-containing protein [Candidatus Obscuribacterales bacterium]
MSVQPNSVSCQLISAADVAALNGHVVLIDVRSPIEFETEHIDGSINLPLPELDTRFDEIPRTGQLVLICRSGKRAEQGAYTLLGRNFQPSILEGGLLAWRKSGQKVKEGKKMLSIERQIQLVVGPGVLSGIFLGVFVNPWYLIIPTFFGAGLTFAGLTGTCALGLLLMRAPWNQLPMTVNSKPSDTSKSNCCG